MCTQPPFWTAAAAPRAGGVVYTNTLTNFETAERPAPLRSPQLVETQCSSPHGSSPPYAGSLAFPSMPHNAGVCLTLSTGVYLACTLRGGILADDMGLGKTLVIISLIATNRPGAELPPTLPPQQQGAADGATTAATAVAAACCDADAAAAQPPAKKRKKVQCSSCRACAVL